jgi:hypothetical protein
MRLVGALTALVLSLTLLAGCGSSPNAISGTTRVTGSANSGPSIFIDGRKPGPQFDIGAILGGGGDADLVASYRNPWRSRILDMLFKPHMGADIPLLKVEIGGAANSTNGSAPSSEYTPGHIDSHSYDLWIAREAKKRNPAMKLIALQWTAPSWVKHKGKLWSAKDVTYVMHWLAMAKKVYGLTFYALGGWNETGYSAGWYVAMRNALDHSTFRSIKLIAADEAPVRHWEVAGALSRNHGASAFNRAVSIVGEHDPADWPTDGYGCQVTDAAKSLGKPLWASEIGRLPRDSGAATWIRSVNRCSLAGLTGFIAWPLINALPPFMPIENRGLITAQWPATGHFRVNRMLWAMAHFTQFTGRGWHYAAGAGRNLGGWGSANAFLAPSRRDWSLVIENTGTHPGQKLAAHTVHVSLAGVKSGMLHVWATNLYSNNPGDWFVKRRDIPAKSSFALTIPAGYVLSVTTTSGQHPGQPSSPAPRGIPLPYHPGANLTGQPKDFNAMDGAFEVMRRKATEPGRAHAPIIIKQMAVGQSVLWGRSQDALRFPYGVAGSPNWSDYSVTSGVLLGGNSSWGGLIGRFNHSSGSGRVERFNGYELSLYGSGYWFLTKNHYYSKVGDVKPRSLALGFIRGFNPHLWHRLSLSLHGRTIAASIDGREVATAPAADFRIGLAGIESSWSRVLFRDFTVS